MSDPQGQSPQRQLPLGHREILSAGDNVVSLGERAFHSKYILRVSPSDDVVERLKAANLALPLKANTISDGDDVTAMWLGPDEWMFVTSPDSSLDLAAKLGDALSGHHHQVADVSDYYTIIAISGTKARHLLAKLSTLDLHPRYFKPGDIAGSNFGKTTGWLVNRSGGAAAGDAGGDEADASTKFDLFVRWSMADYLWCLLAEAGREWGLPAQEPIGQVKGLRYGSG